MHVKSVELHPEQYPTADHYPFNLPIFRETDGLVFETPVTLFAGENGTGKSTLLEALANRCGIHIWRELGSSRFENNPYEELLCDHISVQWANGTVPGSFFGSDTFHHFTLALDNWASADPGQLKYLGGESLVTKSHGQSLMSYFRARYKLRGLYLLDEPETALSPTSQLELLNLLARMSREGHAQFIVATHSPILLACPDAYIYSFDTSPISRVSYEDTSHYRIYRDFMADPTKWLDQQTDG